MRKPVQIATVSLNSDYSDSDIIYALCDDGTIWFTAVKSGDYVWSKVNPIPQDDSQVYNN